MSPPVPAETLTLDGVGVRLEALAWGPADGPLVLCLHGYPDTAWTWRHLGPALGARGLRVVAPFLRGYAPSGLAEDGAYQIGALAADAIALHEQLGAGRPALLIGHDWGAIAAYAAGAHAPERFSRLVTIAVPPMAAVFAPLRALPRSLPLLARQQRNSWYVLFQQLPGVSERLLPRIVRRLWADWSPGYDGAEDVRLTLAALDEPARRTAALRYYRAFVQPWYRRRRFRAEQRAVFAGAPQPTLYLHGRDDGCMRHELAEGASAALPPGSRSELLDGVGHFLHLETPERVEELIASFAELAPRR